MADESTVQEEVDEVTDTEEAGADEVSVSEDTDADQAAADEAGDEEGGEDQADEDIEFDFGGNKFRAPKTAIPENIAVELDKFSKGIWSDYTRKSQGLSEQVKSIEAREKAVEKLSTLNNETLSVYSRGLAVRQELEQLSKVDLNALWQSDSDQARRVSDTISQKQAEFQSIVNRVQQLEGQLNQTQQQETARRMDDGKKEVERRVPGFAEKHLNEVVDYVVKAGVPKESAGDWPLNPIFTEFAYKAMLFDRLQAKAKQAAKPKPAQAQPVKPVATKGGSKPSLDLVKDADKLPVDEWVRRRNAQLRRQA